MGKKSKAKAAARADGVITEAESKQLKELGVKAENRQVTAAPPAAKGTPASAPSSGGGGGGPGARSQVQAALANGNLSRNEALRISESTGKSPEQIMNRAVSQGGTLGSRLVNSYNSNSLPGSNNLYGSTPVGRGDSSMLQALFPQSYSPTMQQVRSAGTLDKGSVLSIGSKGSTQTVLPKSLVTGSAGGNAAPAPAPAPAPTGGGGGGGTPAPAPQLEPAPIAAAPLPPPPEKMGTGGMSSDLDGAAKGFRRNKSSARKMGMTTKGASQLKINLAQGAKSGLNIGY